MSGLADTTSSGSDRPGRGTRRPLLRLVCVEVRLRGEGEITRRLVAIAGGETVDAHAGNDVNTGDRMNVVLGKEGHVVLTEVSRAELRTFADDLLGAATSIRGIVEKVVRIINLGKKLTAEADGVVEPE